MWAHIVNASQSSELIQKQKHKGGYGLVLKGVCVCVCVCVKCYPKLSQCHEGSV